MSTSDNKDTGVSTTFQEGQQFEPPKELSENTYIKTMEQYERLHKESLENREDFWGMLAEEFLTWDKKWDKVFEWEDREKIKFSWFKGGKLNATVNALDRHLDTWRKNKAAIIWEGDEPHEERVLTYMDLYREVNRFAAVLKKHGVKKGDRVALYLPMIPELPIAMLAAARIGAIHSVVFAGFSPDALRDRINDTECKVLVTSDEGLRGGKHVPLKKNADESLEQTPSVEKVVVVKRTGADVEMKEGRDLWWHDEMAGQDMSVTVEPESMDAEDPLFVLYTSGSTGKPKGVLHTTAGYLLFTALSHKWVFDMKEEDTFWCTADIGWVTGHSYIVYGPLINGSTTLMFEGVPTHPEPDRFWAVVEKYKVNQFYTAPTAIRALMRLGDDWVEKHDLSSIRVLGSVGEPINPEAWLWFYKVVGKERAPVVDTYWQTETGGHIITPLPGAMKMKPGSAARPFFGVKAKILKDDGTEAKTGEDGFLVMEEPWPGLMRTVYGDHQRYIDTYWSRFKGEYTTGDGAHFDEDGYIRIIGRLDDVINISGHRLGSAEVEAAIDNHPAVAEAAVVGMPHDVKGQGIYAFVILKQGNEPSEELKDELNKIVRKEIGAIATPDHIQFTHNLPKTRSGKIMRRILTKIASGKTDELGDTTTLADPSVVDELIEGRKK